VHSAKDHSVRSSISKIQNVIADSSLGPKMSSSDRHEEEEKVDEDEIADSLSRPEDHMKLVDWVNAVASQLESCAVELDDDQESFAYSVAADSVTTEDENRDSEIKAVGDSLASGYEGDVERSSRSSRQAPLVPTLESPTSLPTTKQKQQIELDGVLWDTILSRREERLARSSSDSGMRIRSATSISNIKDALPRSSGHHKMNIELRSHQANIQTSSLSATLVYLSLAVAVLVVCGVSVIQSVKFAWSFATSIYVRQL